MTILMLFLVNGYVDMINFRAYKAKDLQNFISFLNQSESEGVTDIRFVRERLQNHINSNYKATRLSKRRAGKVQKIESVTCPECGQSLMVPVLNNEGLKILGCKKCRYSEIR